MNTTEPTVTIPSYMPYHRNRFFVGRETALKTLTDALVTQKGVMVITGTGGMGKTQLAVMFAHQNQLAFTDGIFWLDFEEPETIPQQIVMIAQRTQTAVIPQGVPLLDQAWYIQQQWAQKTAVLLIFDGCEDAALLQQWLPTGANCAVLVTSRCGRWEAALTEGGISLTGLQRQHSLTLLKHFNADIPKSVANEIAACLGDMPLALDLAGNFLATYKPYVIPQDYLRELKDLQDGTLLSHPSLQGEGTRISVTGHVQDVAITFSLSYQRLDSGNDSDVIALAILHEVASHAIKKIVSLEELIPKVTGSRFEIMKGIWRLVRLGLLYQNDSGGVYTHELVAQFVQGQMLTHN